MPAVFMFINRENLMPRLLIALLLGLLSLSAEARKPMMVFGIEDMLWQEFDVYGERLLSESGRRYVLLYQPVGNTDTRSSLSRFYLGDVFYDGQLQDGTPYTATTGYIGFNNEQAWLSRPRGLAGELVLGVDIWSRILDKYGSLGYVETYSVIYSRIGLKHTGRGWNGRAGVKYPLVVNELVNASLLLAPQPEPSLYAELSYVQDRLHFGLYFDSYRFAASPPSGGFYQPTSTMDTVGIRFRFSH